MNEIITGPRDELLQQMGPQSSNEYKVLSFGQHEAGILFVDHGEVKSGLESAGLGLARLLKSDNLDWLFRII